MCESIPADALPPRRLKILPALHRRSVLASACGLLLGACISPTRRRRPLASTRAYVPGGNPAPVPFAEESRSLAPSTPPAAPMTLAVVSRATWGAESLKSNHDPMNGISKITLHHTAELPEMSDRTDLELMKAIQHFHRNTREWADIGYHYVIGRDGRVFEGRDLAIQGAHAGGDNNKHNLGISLIGDFSNRMPDPLQLAVIEAFLREQQAKYGIAANEVHGHRDFKPTECPGTPLYEWLLAFKAKQA